MPHAQPPPALPDNVQVTIVIPIYNAAAKLRQCLDSVLRHTPLSPHCRLLLMDDASSDPDLAAIFASLPDQYVQLARNERNLGYTRSINRAISLCPDGDIALLNSDAIVTPRWLAKLARHAHSAANAGTVTPLSNNAGAFSAPRMGGNALPAWTSIDEAADLLENCGRGQTFDAPTGNGFCMYIRRTLIDAIGLFDEVNFPRGYAEENDFCMRAYHAGFRNLVALDTYVWHYGHGSFGPERAALLADGLDRMRALYPDYFALINVFAINPAMLRVRACFARALAAAQRPCPPIALEQSPRASMRNKAGISSLLAMPRKFCAVFADRVRQKGLRHCLKKTAQAMGQLLRPGQGGAALAKLDSMFSTLPGPSALQAEDMASRRGEIECLLAGANSLVCMIDHNCDGGAFYYGRKRIADIIASGGAALHIAPPFNKRPYLYACLYAPAGRLCLRPPDLRNALAPWLPFREIFINELVTWDEGQPDKLAAIGQTLTQLADFAAALGIPMRMAAHEYFCICPSYNLMANGRYCGLPPAGECEKCAAAAQILGCSANDGHMRAWRQMFGDFLTKLDEVLCFSQASAQIIGKIYPQAAAKIKIQPHEPLARWQKQYEAPEGQPLCAAMLCNGLSDIKGKDIVHKLAKLLRPREKLVILGTCEHFDSSAGNVIFHGAYQRERLPELMAQYGVNCALVPSVWPETFCYVAQECMQLGLPLAAFGLGAQGERVAAYAKGRIAPQMTAESALATLRALNEEINGARGWGAGKAKRQGNRPFAHSPAGFNC